MAYRISLAVFRSNPDTHFRIVEQTVWNYANGGYWSEENGRQVLTMNGSDTSGTLAENGENFIVAVGVDNSKRWSDIVTNLKNDQTGVIINPSVLPQRDHEQQRERHLSSYSIKNAEGRQLAVNFTVDEGENLAVDITIGSPKFLSWIVSTRGVQVFE
ncbi:hypothetical protein C0995_008393 [Termitomyces sp. Mi166|nr:hypothetical protein C0995_008393 [Termitomyces sp. Mi166\